MTGYQIDYSKLDKEIEESKDYRSKFVQGRKAFEDNLTNRLANMLTRSADTLTRTYNTPADDQSTLHPQTKEEVCVH